MTSPKLIRGATAALSLIAFVAVLIFAARIARHVPHSEDEVAYLFQAQVFAQNRLSVPTPPLATAFWSPFVLDYHGQRFGKYPIGWPLLLSLGVRVGQPWLVNALLAALTLAGIAWLAQACYRPPGWLPLLAGGLVLVAPGFLFLSGSLLSHAASLFWVTLALIGLVKLAQTRRPLPALFTGAALGAAFITRPLAAVGVGLAVGLFVLAQFGRQRQKMRLIGWLLLGGLPVAALSPLYWWAVAGHPLFNAYLLVWPYDRLGFGPDVGPLGFTLRDALFINLPLKLTALATGLFGWPGWTNLVFVPVPFLARRANRWDVLWLGLILSLIGVHLFYWAYGGSDGGFPRYYYDALPALVLLTARGITICADLLARRRSGWRWLPLAAVIIFTATNLGWNLPPLLAEQRAKYGISPAPLEAVAAANLPQPALILMPHVTSWSDFAAPFVANGPMLDGPLLFAIAENDAYAQKLRALFPGRSCWLLDGATLTPCPTLSPEK